MSSSEDHEKFRTLRITHLALQFEQLITDEANDHLAPEQLFQTAADLALGIRRENRVSGFIKKAGFPHPTASVAEIDYREGRGVTKVRMQRYAAAAWRQDPRNVLIMSPTGGGKTYVACAIGIAACHTEHSVMYARMDDLARRLLIARGDSIQHQQLLNELSNVDVLILDDFLTIGIDAEAANDLFAILANRDTRLPTIIASQSGPGYWLEALPDRVAADSIVNRLVSGARRINLGTIDMRGLNAERSRKKADHWE